MVRHIYRPNQNRDYIVVKIGENRPDTYGNKTYYFENADDARALKVYCRYVHGKPVVRIEWTVHNAREVQDHLGVHTLRDVLSGRGVLDFVRKNLQFRYVDWNEFRRLKLYSDTLQPAPQKTRKGRNPANHEVYVSTSKPFPNSFQSNMESNPKLLSVKERLAMSEAVTVLRLQLRKAGLSKNDFETAFPIIDFAGLIDKAKFEQPRRYREKLVSPSPPLDIELFVLKKEHEAYRDPIAIMCDSFNRTLQVRMELADHEIERKYQMELNREKMRCWKAKRRRKAYNRRVEKQRQEAMAC